MPSERLPAVGKTVAIIGRLVELPDGVQLELPGLGGARYWPDTPLSTFDPLSDPWNDPFPEERR